MLCALNQLALLWDWIVCLDWFFDCLLRASWRREECWDWRDECCIRGGQCWIIEVVGKSADFEEGKSAEIEGTSAEFEGESAAFEGESAEFVGKSAECEEGKSAEIEEGKSAESEKRNSAEFPFESSFTNSNPELKKGRVANFPEERKIARFPLQIAMLADCRSFFLIAKLAVD